MQRRQKFWGENYNKKSLWDNDSSKSRQDTLALTLMPYPWETAAATFSSIDASAFASVAAAIRMKFQENETVFTFVGEAEKTFGTRRVTFIKKNKIKLYILNCNTFYTLTNYSLGRHILVLWLSFNFAFVLVLKLRWWHYIMKIKCTSVCFKSLLIQKFEPKRIYVFNLVSFWPPFVIRLQAMQNFS